MSNKISWFTSLRKIILKCEPFHHMDKEAIQIGAGLKDTRKAHNIKKCYNQTMDTNKKKYFKRF